MRRLLFLLLLLPLYPPALAQTGSLPSVRVQDLKGRSVQSDDLHTSGRPLIMSFWATWCKPCVKELTAIYEQLPDWTEETGVGLVAVSIDDTRSSSKVAPFVHGRGWDFQVVLDVNGDLKRALNVVNVPHTFLFDGSGRLVWQHTGYAEGDENELYRKLKDMAVEM